MANAEGSPKFTQNQWLREMSGRIAAILLVVLAAFTTSAAQQVSLALLQPEEMQPSALTATSTVSAAHPQASIESDRPHRFWDRENSLLFVTNAALSTADFVVTRDNLRNGGQEVNPVTRLFSGSTTGLAANFAGETLGVVGVSYFLHKTGHHKLERAVSLLNAGSSATAVGFGLTHR